MELLNEIAAQPDDPAARFAAETAVSLIQPYSPHIAEELWEQLGGERLWKEPWPVADRRCWCTTRSRSWCRSTASCAAASGAGAIAERS